jgi:hypothetical protein
MRNDCLLPYPKKLTHYRRMINEASERISVLLALRRASESAPTNGAHGVDTTPYHLRIYGSQISV